MSKKLLVKPYNKSSKPKRLRLRKLVMPKLQNQVCLLRLQLIILSLRALKSQIQISLKKELSLQLVKIKQQSNNNLPNFANKLSDIRMLLRSSQTNNLNNVKLIRKSKQLIRLIHDKIIWGYICINKNQRILKIQLVLCIRRMCKHLREVSTEKWACSPNKWKELLPNLKKR